MKIAYTFLISFLILANVTFVQSQTTNLIFTTKFNDIDIIKTSTRSLNVGDTLLFIFSDTNIAYLNICFNNKCLKYSNIEMGIKESRNLKLQDAVHVNKNDNILWIATTDGLFMFDGENLIRNTKTMDMSDILYKGAFGHAFYKHTNGDIYISIGYKHDFIKYDGIKYDTIVSTLSEEEIYIKAKSPLTNLVAIDNRLYFRTFSDLAYLDLESHEYHYLFLKDTIINNFLTEEELLPLAKPKISDLQKYSDKLFLKIDNLLRNSFFFYDEEYIEKVELERDLIFPNDSSYSITSIYIDSKLRKWCHMPSQRTFYQPYDKKNHYFIIDKDNNYFRIEPDKYGFTPSTGFHGLHEFNNGTTYLNINGGFLVEDPLGVSVTESLPSFFLNKVKPNPFKDRAQVELTATRAAIDNMKVEIFDYLGKSIREIEPFITYQPSNGHAVLELDTDGIRPGYYFLVLTDNNDTRTMPIIIK
ncbi:MAG: hypothetical protein CVV22_12955 [Ignavibacteriae bacterium HGW-Ignavibacteriae-1]|jgi:hypothetical protein|nr:MAG: hypothetical protein CVV22_12955 [Ignavibacteriae bacterium HGW-Ignavibacteriae-1]